MEMLLIILLMLLVIWRSYRTINKLKKDKNNIVAHMNKISEMTTELMDTVVVLMKKNLGVEE